MDEKTPTTTGWEPRSLRFVRYGLVLLFLASGIGKLVGLDAMKETFEHFGYSAEFRLVIGVLETAGAVGLTIRPLVFWAALGLCGIMVGAIWSHVLHDPLYMALPALVVLCLLAVIAWRRSPIESAQRGMRPAQRASDTR
jgi:uncharacterized membrane protein YphA (DoxX/SURF4 family)